MTQKNNLFLSSDPVQPRALLESVDHSLPETRVSVATGGAAQAGIGRKTAAGRRGRDFERYRGH